MTLSERQALSIPLTPSQLRWSLSALWALKEGYTKAVGDGVQTPIVQLVCNFGRGQGGRPATFTHDEVITLFHEMGHGLHQLQL